MSLLLSSFEDLSLKKKLMALGVVASSSALLFSRLFFLGFDLYSFRSSLIHNMSVQAEIVGFNSASAILFEDSKSAAQTLSALQAKPNLELAAIYNKEGKVFAIWRRDKNALVQLPDSPVTDRERSFFSKHSVELLHPIIFDGSAVGTVYLRSDLRELKSLVSQYVILTVVVLFISFIVVILISMMVGNKISDPILELARVAKTVSTEKDYSVRAQNASRDEIGLLTTTFNEMLAQSELNQEALRKSHEDLEQRVQERTLQLEVANAEMAGLNKFLDSIFENMPNMVFVKNASDLRFVRFNKAGETLLGFKREELMGKNDYDFFPKEEADFFTAKDREVLSHQKLLDIEEEPVQTKFEGTKILHTKKIPILNDKGAPQYLLGISEDITARKRAEEAIGALNQELTKKASQLEMANKELEAFSYSVSHDLRAPLRSINGFSKALLDDCGAALTAQGQDDLRRIRAASERMGQLIDDMLNLSRITLSPMRRETVDLSALGRTIIDELRKSHPERQVAVDITEGMSTTGDPRLIRIALENLLGNAWKYSSKRSPARIQFGVRKNGDGPAYFVRDNGAGFDMTYATKLFGAFQRLHTDAEFSGTGIGLATVRRIVSRHDGHIWAESAVDQGASFYFTFS